VLGITDVDFVAQRRELAVVDATLGSAPANANESGS